MRCGRRGAGRARGRSAEAGNALNPNALNPNALNPNALNPAALALSALSLSTIRPNALAAILDPGPAGALSREHLKYTIECAFESSQSFSFRWTDGSGIDHDENYSGMLGLARNWGWDPLDGDEQRWVSACLAAWAYQGDQQAKLAGGVHVHEGGGRFLGQHLCELAGALCLP